MRRDVSQVDAIRESFRVAFSARIMKHRALGVVGDCWKRALRCLSSQELARKAGKLRRSVQPQMQPQTPNATPNENDVLRAWKAPAIRRERSLAALVCSQASARERLALRRVSRQPSASREALCSGASRSLRRAWIALLLRLRCLVSLVRRTRRKAAPAGRRASVATAVSDVSA